MALPKMPCRDRISKRETLRFGGVDKRRSASDGDISDMKNMTGDEYPLLCTRKPRHTLRTLTTPNGMISCDGLWYCDGTSLCHDGELITSLTDSEKTMAVFGDRIIIFPDKVAVDRQTGTVTALEFSRTETGTAVFKNGTYAGEPAVANTLVLTAAAEGLRPGDEIRISGCGEEKNNRTLILREISADKTELRFYEDSFTLPEGQSSYTDSGTVRVERKVPDMDFFFASANRLWGAKGKTVYASKQGDPMNFEVFDGLDSDSWQVDAGGEDCFVGGLEFMGLPCFLKPSRIYKVYGERPSAYELLPGATLGVSGDCGKSLAVSGDTLYYVSRVGVVAYGGGLPREIGTCLGDMRIKNGEAGSDGIKYFLSFQDEENRWHLYCYDTRIGLWYAEDDLHVLSFGWDGALYALCADGKILSVSGEGDGTAETDVVSYAEFGDFTEGSTNKKHMSKLTFRGEINGTLLIKISYDGGAFETVHTLSTSVLQSWYLPLIPHRADRYRIRLEGVGTWRLYSIVREVRGGSEL